MLQSTKPLASSFLPPFPRDGFAARPFHRLPGIGTMKALTPDGFTCTARSLRLLRLAVPTFRPQPRDPSAGRFVSRLSAVSCSRLRQTRAGSPRNPAETGSSSYGLPVHLLLLPTPPHGDAVTFGFWAATNPGTDLHRADKAPSRTHSWRAQADHPRLTPWTATASRGWSAGACLRARLRRDPWADHDAGRMRCALPNPIR